MIKLLGTVPNTACIAVSGGSDSMGVLDFLRNNTWRQIIVLHFNHGTEHANDAESFVRSHCTRMAIPLVTSRVTRDIEQGESREAYWRSERYKFFGNWIHRGEYCPVIQGWDERAFKAAFFNAPIITCHHLDDAVETWIFTSLHGNPMLIPHKRDSFLRPFLSTRKSDITSWCIRKNVQFINDPSNEDTAYMRNFIRHELLPKALNVNPGLHKVVKKKIELSFKNNMDII